MTDKFLLFAEHQHGFTCYQSDCSAGSSTGAMCRLVKFGGRGGHRDDSSILKELLLVGVLFRGFPSLADFNLAGKTIFRFFVYNYLNFTVGLVKIH